MSAGQNEQEERRGASSRAVQAAGEILARWEAERERSPLDRIVEAEFRSRRALNSGERRWIGAAVYGSARFLRRQDFLRERLALPPTPENRIACWLAAPALPDGAPDAASAVETAALSGLDAERVARAVAALPPPEESAGHLRVTLSFPDAMAESLENLLGPEASEAAAAFNARAPATLRVNSLRATRPQVRAALPGTAPTRFSPWGLEQARRGNLHDLPGFREGWLEAQEEASQLVALLADPQPGQMVVDVGAGAGGKTLALAALMQNIGRLAALDAVSGRLEELRKRAHRAGAACIETLALPADAAGAWRPEGEAAQQMQALRGAADVVLLDAPCTGSGVLRRSPDAKWRRADIPAFARLQRLLLEQAGALTAPGGSLVYATCAFERAQNEEVIAAFLDSEPGRAFSVVPAAPRLTAACRRAATLRPFRDARDRQAERRKANRRGGQRKEPDMRPASPALPLEAYVNEAALETLAAGDFLRTWPHRHNLDGFFMACLRREE